jgi:hypothetical protein
MYKKNLQKNTKAPNTVAWVLFTLVLFAEVLFIRVYCSGEQCDQCLVTWRGWWSSKVHHLYIYIYAVGWRSMYFVVMPRVNLIVIFLTYHVYLYSINCPTVICLTSMCYFIYGETPLVNCGPRSYFHHIAITYLLYSHCLLYLHTLLFSTRYTHRKLGAKYLFVCVQIPRCS